MNTKLFFLLSMLCLFGWSGLAQGQQTGTDQPKPEPKKEIEELRLKLNDDGSHYIKATFLNQIWFRGNQSNPGTTALGNSTDQTFDIRLRRTLERLYGQLTHPVLFYFQFRHKNFTYLTQKAHDNKPDS